MKVFVLRFSAFSIFLLAAISPILAQSPNRKMAVELVQRFKAERNPFFQGDIARKLVALGDRSILPDLEPYLNNSNERRMVRANAALVFAGLGDDRGFQIILDILNDKSARGQGFSASPTFETIQQDRYYAAHLFGDLKDPRAVPILIPLLNDPDVKDIVPWSLGQIGDKSAIPPLIETLGDKDPDMRVLAIYALQTLKAKQALPHIRALVSDNQRIHFDGLGPVSEAAKEAIATLEEPPWPSTEGKPVATRVTPDPRSVYYGECQVKYVVNGKEYLLWVAARPFLDESAARQAMSSCPVSSFPIRYNPKDPADAVAMNPYRK